MGIQSLMGFHKVLILLQILLFVYLFCFISKDFYFICKQQQLLSGS